MKRWAWWGVAALTVLHTLDLLTTRIGIAAGRLEEANPMAQHLILTPWALALKCLGLVVLALFVARHGARRSAVVLVWFGVAWFVYVVTSNALIAGGWA